MTVLEAQSLLFEYFCKNHSFNFKEDFIKVVTITENKELDSAILELAFGELIKNNIVRATPDNQYYVLVKPLEHYQQTVSLGHFTISSIAKIINTLAEETKNPELCVDILNIKEKDIQNLIYLIHGYSRNEYSEGNK